MTNSIIRVACIVGLILLIPVFGNLYIEGWDWGPLDFIIMGALLFMVGMTIDLAVRKITDPLKKWAAIGAVIFVFLVIWTELAVQSVSQLIDFIF